MESFILNYWVYAIGFLAQGIFAIRMAIQWFMSEKRGKTESPLIFWQLSLLGSLLLIIYGGLRNDLVIIFGQSLSYLIFIRNLVIEKYWNSIHLVLRMIFIGLPLVILYYLIFNKHISFTSILSGDVLNTLFIIGAVGQLLMSIRFAYQWYIAEKTKSASLPLGFWNITLVGSLMIIVYAVDRLDPVLLVAQSFSFISAVRNIQLQTKPMDKPDVKS